MNYAEYISAKPWRSRIVSELALKKASRRNVGVRLQIPLLFPLFQRGTDGRQVLLHFSFAQIDFFSEPCNKIDLAKMTNQID